MFKIASSIIIAVAFWAFEGQVPKGVRHKVKVASLAKVDQGLGSLSVFTAKLTE